MIRMKTMNMVLLINLWMVSTSLTIVQAFTTTYPSISIGGRSSKVVGPSRFSSSFAGTTPRRARNNNAYFAQQQLCTKLYTKKSSSPSSTLDSTEDDGTSSDEPKMTGNLDITNYKPKPPTSTFKASTKTLVSSSSNDMNNNEAWEDLITDLCILINTVMKKTVIEPVREYVEIQPAGTAGKDIMSKLTAPPEVPGIPRPVWLTMLGSIPTALGWYGYYKFSVEEELYQYELQQSTKDNNGKPKVTGLGGYGTLFPFVYGILLGFPLQQLNIPIGSTIIEASALWILASQINLYKRVNELCSEQAEGIGLIQPEPLHPWWALLPPPIDVIVGLRQIHFLSEYWRVVRGEEAERDVIAERLFPFISSERFTLKELARTPSLWFWFTEDMKDFDIELLREREEEYV